MAVVQIGRVRFGGGHTGFILGPCSLETRALSLEAASFLARLADKLNIGIVFKGSFDKANRTSVNGPRGPGLDEGLRILETVRSESGLPVMTDVHETAQVAAVAGVVDAIQIPAFLARQTDLLAAAGRSGRPVFVKKGQFMAPEDMQHAVAKLGGAPTLCGERGTSFGYRDLIVDYRGLMIMRRYAPVVFDGTHSVQQPSATGSASGGQREFALGLCRAAAAVGVDGFFLETHPRPEEALSDRATQIPLAEIEGFLREILPLVGT